MEKPRKRIELSVEREKTPELRVAYGDHEAACHNLSIQKADPR